MQLSERLEANREDVHRWYRQFVPIEPPPGYLLAWEGVIRPFPSGCDLAGILEHLKADDSVDVHEGGLVHPKSCHKRHGLPACFPVVAPNAEMSFRMRLLLPRPPAHPRSVAISPEISKYRYPTHPHISRWREHAATLPDGREHGPCAYAPFAGDWTWERDTMALYLDFVSVWLAKHVVWLATGGAIDREGGGWWLGSDVPHDARSLLATVHPDDECPCCCGRRYRDCQYQTDLGRIVIEEELARLAAKVWPVTQPVTNAWLRSRGWVATTTR